jgi:hypothetical protein
MTKKEKWIIEQVKKLYGEWWEFKEYEYTIKVEKNSVKVFRNNNWIAQFLTVTDYGDLTSEEAKAAAHNFISWAKENL